MNLHSKLDGWIQNRWNFWVHQSITPSKKVALIFELFSATGRITKIWYSALPLDVMVWVILLAITQRIEGMCLEWFTRKTTNSVKKIYLFYSLSGCPRSTKPKSRPKDGPEAETLRYDLFQIVTLMKIWDKFSILNDLFLILN